MTVVRSQFELTGSNDPIHFSILNALENMALREPQKLAYINGSDRADAVDFKTLHLNILSVASFLHARGYGKGDTMAIVLHNVWQYPVGLFGAWSAGMTTTSPLAFSTAGELSFIFENSSSSVVLCDRNSLTNVKEAAREYGGIKEIIVVSYDVTTDLPIDTTDFDLVLQHPISFDPFTLQFDVDRDVVSLPYSSGTTGPSKGVMWSHRNLQQMMEVLRFYRADLSGKEVDCLILPANGASSIILMSIAALCGNTLVIFEEFDVKTILKNVDSHKIHRLNMVPHQLKLLIESSSLNDYDLHSLKEVMCYGTTVSSDLLIQAENAIPEAQIIRAYGMTELTGFGTIRQASDPIDTIGRLCPGHELKVTNPSTGRTVSVNEEGLLWFRAKNVCLGYLNNPQTNAEVFSDDNFICSGDLGYFDKDGFIYLKGRANEMIATNKGYKISPTDLEMLILSVDVVVDCAVIGVPDEILGESPRAYIAVSRVVDPNEIHNFVNAKVSDYKRLAGGIEFVQDIPRNSTGKIMRRKLLESYLLLEKSEVH